MTEYRVEHRSGAVLITDDRVMADAIAAEWGVTATIAPVVTGVATVLDDAYDLTLSRQAELDRAWDEYTDRYNGNQHEEPDPCEHLR